MRPNFTGPVTALLASAGVPEGGAAPIPWSLFVDRGVRPRKGFSIGVGATKRKAGWNEFARGYEESCNGTGVPVLLVRQVFRDRAGWTQGMKARSTADAPEGAVGAADRAWLFWAASPWCVGAGLAWSASRTVVLKLIRGRSAGPVAE